MKQTVEGKHGRFSVHDTDRYIGRALIETGTYSEDEVQFLCSLVKPGDTVVEVGANIGSVTVPLAKRVDQLAGGAVYAFEPQPQVFELLKANLAQNDLGWVRTYALALGEAKGRMAIAVRDFDKPLNSGDSALIPANAALSTAYEVGVSTLDSFGLKRLDLIKIDVEGSEADVIAGAAETIRRLQPILFVENDRHDKSRTLILTLMELDYRLWWRFDPIYDPDETFTGQSIVAANMVCLHKSRPIPDSVKGLTEIINEHESMDFALMRDGEKKPKKLVQARSNDWACIVRLGGVGDNLICSAVLPHLKRKYGHVEVIAADPQAAVFENNPHVDKLTVKGQGEPKWEDGFKWQEYWADRATEYAFFANLSHSCETTRALTRIQTQYYWPASVRRKLCGGNYVEMVADICETPYDELEIGFYPTEAEIAAAAAVKKLVGGRYIAWVLTGSRIDKIWPPTAVVIAQLIKDTGLPVVMLGGPGRDFELAKKVQTHVESANGSLKGLHLGLSASIEHPHWPVRRVLTQTLLADVVVSPDTGPAWAVAHQPMPKVVLLSHASPENITKGWKNTLTLHADASIGCWPCHLLIDRTEDCERLSGRKGLEGAACISSIKPDVVIAAVQAALKEKNTWPTLPAMPKSRCLTGSTTPSP